MAYLYRHIRLDKNIPFYIGIGSENFSSKLTEEDVISIRKIYENKEHSHSKLAKIYGVSKNNIGSILNRNTWKHI